MATRSAERRTHLVGTMGVVLFAAAAAWGDGPTLSLKAVAINGVPIAPTNQIVASSGDIITCEVYGSNWSPNGERLKAWQVMIDGERFGTDDVPVIPAYWDQTCPFGRCDGICPAGYVCDIWSGCCHGPDHHPEAGAFIDDSRLDYVYAGSPPVMAGVDFWSLSFRYAATLLQPNLAPVYAPPPKYFATFTLKIMRCACGTFTVGLLDGFPHTYFMDALSEVIAPTTVDLEISTWGECWAEFVASDPPDCAIDARQPCRPDGTNVVGWNSITLMADGPCYGDLCTLTPAHFSVEVVPAGGIPPQVVSVTCPTANSVKVTFNKRIPLRKWTCVSYMGGSPPYTSCMAHLPGDVNGDRTTSPADILRVIDCLNGVASCKIWQCDVDRSHKCGPPDILRVIDILNGAGAYDVPCDPGCPRLPPCPSEP